MGGIKGGMMSGGMGPGIPKDSEQINKRLEELMRTIKAIVPESWYENGGQGNMNHSGPSLIIYQMPQVHQKIKEYLKKERERFSKQIAIEARFLLVTENFLEDISTTKSGELRIGCPQTPAMYIMPRLITQFKEAYPGIKIILDQGTGDEMIQSMVWTPTKLSSEDKRILKNLENSESFRPPKAGRSFFQKLKSTLGI